MLSWFYRRYIDRFEQRYNYDMTYVREILDTSPRAARAYLKAIGIGQCREGVPLDVLYVTGLVAIMHEDCGPCAQLTVDMALEAGVPRETLRAVVNRRPELLSDECALAVRFAEGVLGRDPGADAGRAQVRARWGDAGLISLAFAMTAAKLYPTVKYALGHGKACVRLKIAGEFVDRGAPATDTREVA